MYRDPSSYERLIGDTEEGITEDDSYLDIMNESFTRTEFLLENGSLEDFFQRFKEKGFFDYLVKILEKVDLLNDETIEIDGIEFNIEDFCFYFGKVILGLDDLEKGDNKKIKSIKEHILKWFY